MTETYIVAGTKPPSLCTYLSLSSNQRWNKVNTEKHFFNWLNVRLEKYSDLHNYKELIRASFIVKKKKKKKTLQTNNKYLTKLKKLALKHWE